MFNIMQWWRTRHIRAKRRAAEATGSKYYGTGGTIHRTGELDVETHDGKVVAVWFRCMPLPFRQVEARPDRAQDMRTMYPLKHFITGVEIKNMTDQET